MARSDTESEEESEGLDVKQLEEAKKMTQELSIDDANKAFKERSEMREAYFVMTSKVTEATRELKEKGTTALMHTDEGFDEMEKMIERSQEYYAKMGASTKELACDAQLMLTMGQLLLAGAQQMQRKHIDRALQPEEFVKKIDEFASGYVATPLKLVSDDPAARELLDDSEDEELFRPRNVHKRLPDGVPNDADEMSATKWAAIGRAFGGLLKLPPTMSFFRPLLQDTAPLPTQPKTKKERAPKDEKSKAKAVVLSEKDKNHDDPDQSVTRELDCIRKSLRRELRKMKGHILSYYGFVIDPGDFSKSVENMFYTSFLVKDGYIRIEIDPDEGLPRIVVQAALPDMDGKLPDPAPAAGGSAPAAAAPAAGGGAPLTPAPPSQGAAADAAAANCLATQQAIVGFAFDIWEGMIDCLNIKEAAIRR